jgi:hypothetical protein
MAIQRQKDSRIRNKDRFDKTHRIRPKKLEEGDWVLMYDNSLDNQHSTIRKFAKRWFWSYIIKKVYDNATYKLSELDGSLLQNLIPGKRIKIFKKRNDFELALHNDEELAHAGGCAGSKGVDVMK